MANFFWWCAYTPQSPLTRCFWGVTAALLLVILLYIGDKIGCLHLRTPANTIDPPVRDRKHTTAIYRYVLSVTPEVTAAVLLVIYRCLKCRHHDLLSCYISSLEREPAVLLVIYRCLKCTLARTYRHHALLSCYISSLEREPAVSLHIQSKRKQSI